MKLKYITSKTKPNDIKPANTISYMGSIWGQMESEVGAKILLRFAQSRNSWKPFTKKEIDAYSKHDFWFNYLSGNGITDETPVKLKLVRLDKPLIKSIFERYTTSDLLIYTHKLEETKGTTLYHFTDVFINEMIRLSKSK